MANLAEEAVVYKHKVEEAAAYIRARCPQTATAIVLGSGLMALTDKLQNTVRFPYAEIPYFPAATVSGHSGELLSGDLAGQRVYLLAGRFHYYEGHTPAEVVFPVRVLRQLGVETLVLTNAAGGVNLNYAPGSLMRITDHINFMGMNPLVGANLPEWGPRFPDLSQAYDAELGKLAQEVARQEEILLHEGVYAAFSGPSYETPAEIRMAAILGADAVGMSTVPEVIAARHLGLRVLGISCITNAAAGLSAQALSHTEVLAVSKRAEADFCRLLLGIAARLGEK